jgi:hypothetical protein
MLNRAFLLDSVGVRLWKLSEQATGLRFAAA